MCTDLPPVSASWCTCPSAFEIFNDCTYLHSATLACPVSLYVNIHICVHQDYNQGSPKSVVSASELSACLHSTKIMAQY